MAFPPVVILLDGAELEGWTEMALTRSKDRLTGELSVSMFMGYLPDAPVAVEAARGREVTVYIGGQLAFIGYVDKRTGTGARHGEPGTTQNNVNATGGDTTLSIGPNEYTVRLSCRGKAKRLIDSSHQHPTTNMVDQPTTRDVINKLVEPWNIEVEWLATEVKLDKVRFRDGSRVIDELQRVGLENAHFIYETRDGKLRVTDDIGPTRGEPIILGMNILQFNAEQAESISKSSIKVKGQRTARDVWGEAAVFDGTVIKVDDDWNSDEAPIIVQHYGDATPETLERRGRFEMNKRASASKRITLDVFHVQTPSGQPWDIGQLHYVEIPPEGVYDEMECISLTYTVQNDQTLKTQLVFAPPPAGPSSGTGFMSSLPELANEFVGIGNSRRAAARVSFTPGNYPAPWGSPNLSVVSVPSVAEAVITAGAALFATINTDKNVPPPPLTLPASFKSKARRTGTD